MTASSERPTSARAEAGFTLLELGGRVNVESRDGHTMVAVENPV
jgi:hypothetical protein